MPSKNISLPLPLTSSFLASERAINPGLSTSYNKGEPVLCTVVEKLSVSSKKNISQKLLYEHFTFPLKIPRSEVKRGDKVDRRNLTFVYALILLRNKALTNDDTK